MRLAAIIQVAVGIIFVFILLSIVVTEVNSLIARATKLRSKTLRATINTVIEDPVIRAKVFTHPLIQLVKAAPVAPSQRISRDEAESIANSAIGSIDYIDHHPQANSQFARNHRRADGLITSDSGETVIDEGFC